MAPDEWVVAALAHGLAWGAAVYVLVRIYRDLKEMGDE